MYIGLQTSHVRIHDTVCLSTLRNKGIWRYIKWYIVCELFTWNAKGIPRLKTGLVSNFIFFVGSHKCTYPTDIELSSDQVNLPLYPSVYPNFPAPVRNHILSLRFAIMCALDHSATATRFCCTEESNYLLWNLSAGHDWHSIKMFDKVELELETVFSFIHSVRVHFLFHLIVTFKNLR